MTTNGGPVEVLGRFRGVVGSLPPRLFGGAIGEGFGEWLGGRWGLGGGRPPSPARRVFRKEKGRVPVPRRPAGRPVRFSNYQLNATLRLTLNLPPSAATSGARVAESAFVPVTASLAVARGNGATAAGLLSRESWTSFRLLSERLRETARLSSRERTLKILFGGGGGAAGVGTHAPGSAGRSKGGAALARPSFAAGPLSFLHSSFTEGPLNLLHPSFAAGPLNFLHLTFAGGLLNLLHPSFATGPLNLLRLSFAAGPLNFL
ncbi:MAG TPA: hypothetical protein VFS10_06155, partial [Pyrinomonadaceae bacterium]|nr:hypothetical protein [Pyrinomonadaceae bacterium]